MTMPMFSNIIFYIALIIGFIISYYGFALYTQVKGSSLAKVVLFATLSAILFGFHHLGESLFEESPAGLLLAELLESVAALLLLISVYYIYKVSNEIFIPESYAYRSKK